MDQREGDRVLRMIVREKEGKEEVKKERTDLLPVYIFEKEVQAQCTFSTTL